MAVLRRTQNALSEWMVEASAEAGRHASPKTLIGVPGRRHSSSPFRTDMPPHAINPANIKGIVTGWPHVDKKKPFRLLAAKVVVHLSGEQTMEELFEGRYQLGANLTNAVKRSMPRNRDRVNTFLIGRDEEELKSMKRGIFRDAELDKGSEDPDVAALTVAKLCQNGLTFVLSDFEELPITAAKGVAVKLNHELELSLDSVAGRKAALPYGNGREVRLWKPAEVTDYNENARAHHQAITSNLERVGMAVAQVVFSDRYDNGFNSKAADQAIAGAIRSLQS